MTDPQSETLSYAQLQVRWQALIESRFAQDEFERLLVAVGDDLKKESFLREVANLMREERMDLDAVVSRSALDLEKISPEEWPMTTRIDGIMPLTIPLASDLTLVASRFFREMDTLGFDYPALENMERVEDEIGLCLLAWMHERPLRSSFGMRVELNTQCPRSALSCKDSPTLMGTLPNGSRITIFYSRLKASECLAMPGRSLEYFDRLEAARDAEGVLRLHGANVESAEVGRP